ncbi:anthranilate synthase component I family protein [Pedobacter sp. MR2016-24]|uniref:anthranilate synthase component I family protein n=1 Tax=Pedobacter sp. MR2016-24 TaxID=2994466 RepID=UPI002247479F|nr:anthranilate synthase component I family protein [Pedobacter sp. MR2016-24]MCX2485078.1 anthranilate synthase component I family protein [Pedobacter sp. MR2016-24]
MKKININTFYKKRLADTTTPVSIYLRLRDVFPNTLLLESSDYHSRENSVSYVCADPVAGIILQNGKLSTYFPDGTKEEKEEFILADEIESFKANFDVQPIEEQRYISTGLFGYFTWNTVQYFEDIKFGAITAKDEEIPLMQYHVYRYIIAIDHFKNEVTLFKNDFDHLEKGDLGKIEYLIQNKNFPEYSFDTVGAESSNLTDDGFKAIVEKMKTHILRGDVFQIVPSRAFNQGFSGDEFNVYRCLRSINPSPYLFYFDYGSFKLFGSSPEAQITIKKNVANIFPIAGTFKRTGNDEEDAELARQLEQDPKESAEHVMLVDLARNDLSRHCRNVQVKSFKEVQYYSHLIHLVSKVSGNLQEGVSAFKVVADTYPAGTLSGAPKYKAMQLIDEYEGLARNFYAGALGYMGFGGEFNHAIMIRTFMSKNNQLHYRAGAGIVADSIAENELNEVNNKIAALRKAIEMAKEINHI